MGRALIVVDMLNDFITEKGALSCGPTALGIVPFARDKIDHAHKEGDMVVYLCDSHSKDDLEFKMFPAHCIVGTPGADIIPELAVGEFAVPGKMERIIPKKRYSGFYGTNLESCLRAFFVGKQTEEMLVEVVGVCTSICIMDTVGGLRNRDYSVTVYKEGVADFDDIAHKFALKRMADIYGAMVI